MKLWIGSLCLVVGLDLVFCQEVRSEQDEKMSKFDPSQHLWLEEVEGEEALTWVREQNERSLSELEADGDFEADLADALEVLTSKERIPYGKVRGDYFYNFCRTRTTSGVSGGEPRWNNMALMIRSGRPSSTLTSSPKRRKRTGSSRGHILFMIRRVVNTFVW